MNSHNLKAYLTEFLGSFIIIFISCWSIITTDLNQIDSFGSNACVGLVTAACIWAGVAKSGAHFNPVIILVKLAIRQFEVQKAVLYIVFQLLGSFLGALIVILIIPYEYQ